MKIRSIRRIVHDSNHNMCTGATYFKDALFVAFRQGDAHVSPNGKVLVIRSRDEGKTFEHVNLLRGKTDTRDPHLYKIGEERLYAVAFETDPVRIAGTSWTDDGIHWSPFTRYTGADGWWMWHPEYHDGKHYCCAYTWKPGIATRKPWSAIGWFESDNGIDWKHIATLDEGDTQPSEANLAFRENGEAVLLVRRDFADQTPVLMTSKPPYRKWTRKVIDLNIVGLAMWLVDGHIWFAGRWFLHDDVAQMGVFRMEKGNPALKMVLPAGPGFDFSYMGVAKHPLNSARYWLSYYSNHTAPDDPNVDQWSHPAIYLVDALFDRPFVERFKVSDVVKHVGRLDDAKYPDPSKPGLKWHDIRAYKMDDRGKAASSMPPNTSAAKPASPTSSPTSTSARPAAACSTSATTAPCSSGSTASKSSAAPAPIPRTSIKPPSPSTSSTASTASPSLSIPTAAKPAASSCGTRRGSKSPLIFSPPASSRTSGIARAA